ncbi:MAG TPA: efflux RND transporter permease subunit, partial [Polyangia bacterium]|nr:efflux RND transporter permease subunit [Polyangia bacterium]
SVDDLADTVVGWREGVAIRLRQVAAVQLGTGVKRGDAGVNGAPAVILAVQKQPGASTVGLTRTVERALADLSRSLPADVRVVPLFRQATFIETAIGSVVEALRDGAILVVIVLCIFLFSLRTTVITLTAIPLSFLVTAVVLSAFHLSVNTMTLGGLAVAIGELVDDAIVDVENVYRRLRENRAREKPEPILAVIYRASSEVRNSIVFATIIVVLVFLPLFALGGIEGRLFAPLGVAYIVSILASLVVSLTVTPALCSYLLPNASFLARSDSFVVRWLKAQDRKLLDVTLAHPWKVMIGAGLLVAAAACVVPFLGREFMPPFNEGSATIHVTCVPGTSLDESNRVGQAAERLLLSVSEVASVGRRTGRAEQDEHAEGVHASEIDVDFKKSGGRPRAVVLDEIRRRLTQLPGVAVNIGQPISHRLDHLLSGVRAQIAVKLFGPDLPTLRSKARELQQAMAKVDGIVDLQIEQQTLIPQLVIRLKRDEAARYGIQSGAMAELLETAIGGHTVAQILDGPRAFDVVVRYDARSRADRDALARTLVDTPSGAKVPLGAFAEVREDLGPNLINHDDVTRRIVVMANARHRDLGSVVAEVKRRIDADVKLPTGYWIAYEGQFESQQSATRLIGLLSLASLAGMFLVLFGHFRSLRLVLQVMLNIPLALVGSVAAILLTDGTFSIATLVGFVTLCGIASRNTIMMISHYRELQREGAPFDRALVVRGSLERLVPVLMTALTAALALVPLVLARGQPGKEILYPVATVILGGLVSSTLLDMVVTPAVFFKFGKPAPDSDDPERI